MLAIEDAVVVVAHPDDEILWCSSILRRCKAVVVCFGPSASSQESWDGGRARLMANYPLTKARFLKLREGGVSTSVDWNQPMVTEAGLRLRRPNAAYEENGRELLRVLRPILAGERLIVTHNPWGEYGHAEHVQVSNAVRRLQAELGFDLFVNGYVSNRSFNLMLSRSTLLEGPPLAFETDTALAAELKQAYTDHDCWTWFDDYEWPMCEVFYRIADHGARSTAGAAPPLTYINYDCVPNVARRVVGQLVPRPVKSRIKRLIKLFRA